MHALAIIAAVGAICGLIYQTLCLLSALSFARKKIEPPRLTPPVSVLKPLRGTDPHAYDCLRSHCTLDYPEYEVLFGVSDSNDPAVPIVERLTREFQHARLLLCPEILSANRKVSTLAQLVKSARYEHFVISDSDIFVTPEYLHSIMSPLADVNIGLVTSLYRGVPERTLWSSVEALAIVDFAASVLLAYRGNFHYGFGSTLAFSRETLNAIGGLAQFADYLADDYQLATAIARSGKKVVLAPRSVTTLLPDYSFAQFWQHQLRWSRTVRDANPAGYFGLLLTFGIMWSTIALIASHGSAWAWALFALNVGIRVATTTVVISRVLRDRNLLREDVGCLTLRETDITSLALPIRVFVEPIIWAASWLGNSITWRGEPFRLRKGKLQKI
jgi:ceramide glucosyltransferase